MEFHLFLIFSTDSKSSKLHKEVYIISSYFHPHMKSRYKLSLIGSSYVMLSIEGDHWQRGQDTFNMRNSLESIERPLCWIIL